MARRRKNKTRRRRFKGINLWNVGESLVQATILTQGAFNVDPLAFLIGKYSTGYGNKAMAVSNYAGVNRIGLGELLFDGSGKTAAEERAAAWANVKSNWPKMLGMSIVTRVGFAGAKKLTRGIRRDMNKGIKMAGLHNEVKV
jgi:hypothetical protein